MGTILTIGSGRKLLSGNANKVGDMTPLRRRVLALGVLAFLLWWGTTGASWWLRLKSYDVPASMVSGLLIPGTAAGSLLGVLAIWKPHGWVIAALLAAGITQVVLVLLKWN